MSSRLHRGSGFDKVLEIFSMLIRWLLIAGATHARMPGVRVLRLGFQRARSGEKRSTLLSP